MSDVKTELHYDESEDKLTIHTVQDVEPILEANKRSFANIERNHGYKSDVLNHVARIPLVIAEKWKRELGVDVFNRNHEQKVKALLNSPEYQYLRTRPGRI